LGSALCMELGTRQDDDSFMIVLQEKMGVKKPHLNRWGCFVTGND